VRADVVKAMAGYDLKLTVRVELGGEPPEDVAAEVKMTIEDALYAGLPERYPHELYDQQRDDLYRHIYTAG